MAKNDSKKRIKEEKRAIKWDERKFKDGLKRQKKLNRIKYGLGRKYVFFYVPVIAVILISVASAVFLVALWFIPGLGTENLDGKAESAIVGTGLAMIGIAISVWAGLNIVNAVERKEFEDLNVKLAELTRQEVTKSLPGRYKELFAQELLKTKEDPMTAYFYMEFSKDLQGSFIEYPFDDMLEVEQLFSQVYLLHTSDEKYNSELIAKADKGIELIGRINLLHFNSNKLLKIYLTDRKADLNFYKGYCDKSANSIYRNFLDSIEKFFKIAKDLQIQLPEFPEKSEEKTVVDNHKKYEFKSTFVEPEKQSLTIYFANSVGEAYSKILQNGNRLIKNELIDEDELKTYGEKAKFYCQCAVEMLDAFDNKKLRREVYYRNYAVAMENYSKHIKKDISFKGEEIIENYKKAFKLILDYNEPNEQRVVYVYYALLSYYNRYLNKVLEISKLTETSDDENIFDTYNRSFKKSNDELKQIASLLKDFYLLSDFSILDKNRKTMVYSMKAFALRDIILLKQCPTNVSNIINSYFPEDNEYYKELFYNVLNVIDYLENEDDYAKTLRLFKNLINKK